jgi:uncharacterized membrane protein
MKLDNTKSISIVLFLFILSLLIVSTVYGESRFEVATMKLTVYRDGLVHAKQTLTVDDAYPEIFLPLLASLIENVIVLDENQTSVDYRASGLNFTVFTLGAKQIVLEYDTTALTRKESEVWTLVVDNPYNLTVSLPKNSTVIYLSQMPTAIDTEGDGISLSLYPGSWEISYVIPILPQEEQEGNQITSSPFPSEYLFAAAAAAIVSGLAAFIFVKRRRKPSVEKISKANPQLMKEDKEVLEFLLEKGGKAFEAEIRVRFPDMPRTSLWRLVRRLERLEIVEVKKIGLENQVQLKK